MRLILAVTRSRVDVADDVVERAVSAFDACTGEAPAIHQSSGPAADQAGVVDVFLGAPEPGDHVSRADDTFGVVLQRSAYSTSGQVVDGAGLLEGVRTDADRTLHAIVAPFGGAYRARAGGPVVLSTDTCGLRHVYTWRGDGWAAAASSSVLLALVVGAALDEEAMGMFATFGYHLGDRTPFRGITRLDPGTRCHVAEHGLTIETFARHVASAPVVPGLAEQARRGADAIRDAVGACLAAHPDLTLELSGGFDSRAVLAAIPRARRRGRLALTLGRPGSPEVEIASDLAAGEGLEHRVIDLRDIDAVEPDEALALVRAAARRRDCTANPIGTGVLDWVEAQVDQRPRLNGQNAEFGRAPLYPGQRQHAAVTDDLSDRMVRWYGIQNHVTDPAVVQPSFLEAGMEASYVSVRQTFRSFDADWLRSLDEYYLQSRMQRWVGIDYTAVGYDRTILTPFCNPAYLAWVRSCDPRVRRGSRVFAAMFDELDPQLAAASLLSGVSPHEVAGGGPIVAAKRARVSASMVGTKVVQRMRRGLRAPIGAERLAELVVTAWRRSDDPTTRLSRYAFIDGDGLAQVLRGERSIASATVALLVDLEVLTEIEDRFEQSLAARRRATVG